MILWLLCHGERVWRGLLLHTTQLWLRILRKSLAQARVLSAARG